MLSMGITDGPIVDFLAIANVHREPASSKKKLKFVSHCYTHCMDGSPSALAIFLLSFSVVSCCIMMMNTM